MASERTSSVGRIDTVVQLLPEERSCVNLGSLLIHITNVMSFYSTQCTLFVFTFLSELLDFHGRHRLGFILHRLRLMQQFVPDLRDVL